MRAYGTILLCAMGLTITGCGTMIHGVHQDVAIQSDPGIAKVTIDGQERGMTPLVASLWRGETHVVKFERDGHAPIELSVTQQYSPWTWGNGVSLGLGLLIDAWTGGMYDLSHTRLIANFPTYPRVQTATTVANQPPVSTP